MLAQFSSPTDGPGVILLIGLLLCAAVAMFAFWLWMLLDCAQISPGSSDYHARSTWILVIVFVGWLGAVLYFFMVRQPRLARRRSRLARTRQHPPGHRTSRSVSSR